MTVDPSLDRLWPTELRSNGCGARGPLSGKLSSKALSWASEGFYQWARATSFSFDLLPDGAPDRRDWRHPEIGWGLIVPEPEGYSHAELAAGDDLGEPLRELLRSRPDAPILRYRPRFSADLRNRFLRDWKHGEDVALEGSERGVAPGRLPYYLLIAASPEQIPWRLQTYLNGSSRVGRLDLDAVGMERYVSALISDWNEIPPRSLKASEPLESRRQAARRSVIWAVDHGGGDITSLMRQVLALEARAELDDYSDLSCRFLDGRRGEAGEDALRTALAREPVGLVLTSSHGYAEPGDPHLKERLGLPVDEDFKPLDLAALVSETSPDGAVWLAQGCCTAGSSGESMFRGLFEPGSEMGSLWNGLETLGDIQAPLPRALLGARRPARAFIGQVEPSFDWTLKHPRTLRGTAHPLVTAVTRRLFSGTEPLGFSLMPWFERIAPLYMTWEQDLALLDLGEIEPSTLLYGRLAARDIQTTVLLGDPTVRLPTR